MDKLNVELYPIIPITKEDAKEAVDFNNFIREIICCYLGGCSQKF